MLSPMPAPAQGPSSHHLSSLSNHHHPSVTTQLAAHFTSSHIPSKVSEAEIMPLDLSMLLGTSPPTNAFLPSAAYERLSTFDPDLPPPYACRRAASFPLVSKHTSGHIKASSMKIRSLSEAEALNKKTTRDQWTLAELKRELANMAMIKEETTKAIIADAKRRNHKKVSFADDHGVQLAMVKIMTEPSDVPPKLDSAIIRSLLGEAAEEARPSSTWVVNFSQPACEYLKFRQTLEDQGVALENVLVKNEECRLVGTVKVKNISFEKEVFIRISDNDWESYMDKPAKYMPGPAGDVYDTFSFAFEIPADDAKRQRLAFCVCFKAGGDQEFWDSQDGKNFEIISEKLRDELLSPKPNTRFPRQRRRTGMAPLSDAYLLDSETNWGEFSSWKNLSTQEPYY